MYSRIVRVRVCVCVCVCVYVRVTLNMRNCWGFSRIRAEPDDFRVDMAGVTRNREHVAGFLSPLIMATAVDGAW